MTPDRFAPFGALIAEMSRELDTGLNQHGYGLTTFALATTKYYRDKLAACLAEARRAEPSATLTVLDNAFGVTALIDDSMRERDRLHRDAYRLMMVVKKYFGDDAVRTADVIGFLDEQLAAREEPPR